MKNSTKTALGLLTIYNAVSFADFMDAQINNHRARLVPQISQQTARLIGGNPVGDFTTGTVAVTSFVAAIPGAAAAIVVYELDYLGKKVASQSTAPKPG